MRGSSPRMTAKNHQSTPYIPRMRPQDILIPVPAGLCCKPGGFHIDPVRPVERAVITHGHSDHARAGHGAVLATQETLDMMRLRYGDNFAGSTQAIGYGETIKLGDVSIKFHPAGHVLGSAQIAAVEVKKLLASVALFPERAHLVGAYSLGKAQRVIALLRGAGYDAPIYLHGAMEKITRYYESRGIALGELRMVKGVKKADLAGTITLAPPSATSDVWTRRFPDPVTAFASGWMRVRARARQGGIELPLVISDHADWDGLTATIDATGAREIWVTHGQEDALVHWCKAKGLAARPLDLVGYGDEDEGEAPVAEAEA
jgi:putative mRNA 3-end processing factor